MADTWEIHGVTVRQERSRSGPVWKWHLEGRRSGIVLHHEIQWVEEDGRWLRKYAVSEPGEEGGFTQYQVHYRRVYDADAAAEVVYELLERELGQAVDLS